MTRLLVHVEGQTEETFVNEVLAPHLYVHGWRSVGARLIGNARQRAGRGGIQAWSTVRKDVVNHLRQDRTCVATIMVDYYGMPQTGSRAWPGRYRSARLNVSEKAKTIEDALAVDIREAISADFDDRRFIPYVMMHEFEAMLFSDCKKFGEGIGQPQLAPCFQKIRDKFASPEEIDDSPNTAPSRRILELVPTYQKPLMGTRAVLEIGLDSIRAECLNFRAWIERLESKQA